VRALGETAVGVILLLLGSTGAFAADPLFIGRWSIDPAGCKGFGQTAQTTPLVISERAVNWFQSTCSIKKSYRIGNGLYLEAQCWTGGALRVMPIGLQLKGRMLQVTWDQAVAGEMQRCR